MKIQNFLAFLKATCPQIAYWVHFTLKAQDSIYIYVHFPLVDKQLIGFYSQSETKSIQVNVNKACNELRSNNYYKILIGSEVIMYVPNHLKEAFVILK